MTVISFCKVPVERSDDGVLAIGVIHVTAPLADTRPAGICQHHTPDLLEDIEQTIPGDGIAHLLGTRCYGELRFRF
jgi:hypothetical protein